MPLTRMQLEDLIRDSDSAIDLRGQDLRRLAAAGLDLPGANLSQAHMRQANLRQANLERANLSGGDLSEADLSEATLSGALLSACDLSQAKLTRANLRQADLRNAALPGADLRQADLRQAMCNEADLTDADLHQADLREADLVSAQLSRATLTSASMQRVSLINADLNGATLAGADLREAILRQASLSSTDMRQVDLSGADLSGADLSGVDLREANLFQTNLRGARYNRATTWPDGVDLADAGLVFLPGDQATTLTGIWPGQPYPLGATWDGRGVNFALYSATASRVELCLFDSLDAPYASARITMPEQTDEVWHVYLPDLRPGQIYAYRVYGPYNPDHGQRFNPHKLLIDPYARALTGVIQWNDTMFGYTIGHPDQDRSFDTADSAPFMPRCVVVDDTFPWGDDRPLNTPLHQSVIYELHVRGFTMQHPEVPEALRGTYAGLASPPVIAYLKALGVTAVELLPVHHHVDDRHLVERSLKNYWGYNTLSFFAPDIRYSRPGAPGDQVREFKSMVKTLHAAGIEVILDVVYNHTAEGSHLGPTLSLRGIDNQSYYRLVPDNPRYYMDYTGCGNTLNVLNPRTLQLIMDSLRYWVTEMHVDGFRFDLASALVRGLHEADRLSAFFDVIHQDPILSRVKLIAEPWDLGPGGYQVGAFPVLWAEWNGRYRDTVRRFWKGDGSQVADLAYRLSGSSDLYQHNGRRPYASINFVTAHDGFTLRDLVSYNEKHNEANGEENRDGEQHNNSWNCGAEGLTDDPAVNALRARQQRNLLATLLLSQGVPMLLAGDERGRTQQGNNNAYCQDNPISWLDWRANGDAQRLLAFTQRLLRLRRAHPILARRRFFQGRRIHGTDIRDISWLRPDGAELSDSEWHDGHIRCVGMLLNGLAMNDTDAQGRQITDSVLLLLLNAHYEAVPFVLPDVVSGQPWVLRLDTSTWESRAGWYQPGQPYPLAERSLTLLVQPRRSSVEAEQEEL